MKAHNVTRQDLEMALFNCNATHGYSLRFREDPRPMNTKATTWQFTIRSERSKMRGARVSASGINTPAASWHAHGHFFEALLEVNPDARITTGLHGKRVITKDGGNWEDAAIQNMGCKMMLSETSIF